MKKSLMIFSFIFLAILMFTFLFTINSVFVSAQAPGFDVFVDNQFFKNTPTFGIAAYKGQFGFLSPSFGDFDMGVSTTFRLESSLAGPSIVEENCISSAAVSCLEGHLITATLSMNPNFNAKTLPSLENPVFFVTATDESGRTKTVSLISFKLKQVFPSGVDSITGTVGVTPAGAGGFNDVLTVTGGPVGGTMTIKNELGIRTADLTVPADTITTLRIDSMGDPLIESTNAPSAQPLGIKNIKLMKSLYPDFKHEALARMPENQELRISQGVIGEMVVKAPLTNTLGVSLFVSSLRSESSDCDPTTCKDLGGSCNDNWCIPNEDTSSVKNLNGRKYFLEPMLRPGEDIHFASHLTPSGHKILDFFTSSGLMDPVRANSLVHPGYMLTFGSFQGAEFILADVLGVKNEFILPFSNNDVEGVSIVVDILPTGVGLNVTNISVVLPIKVRQQIEGGMIVAKPAEYKFDFNGDSLPDVQFTSNSNNQFFKSEKLASYDQLSATRANGENLILVTTSPQPVFATVIFKGVTQRKDISQSKAFNFMNQKDKVGNIVTVAGNSRTITGSLIEEISPAAIIEGWNYWYAATDNDYWQWSVILNSLPVGCTSDKTTASTSVANGVQTLAFYVDCGTTNTITGAVVSGMPTADEGSKGFAAKGKASLLSEFTDCTKVLPNGGHQCKPSQQFRDEARDVVKGVMNPTGSAVRGLGSSGGVPLLLISLLTLAGVIVLIAIQIRRKTVDW